MGKMYFIIMLLIILAVNVFPQDTFVITSETAVKMAVENNLKIKKEDFTLSEKRRSRNNRYNALVPDISAGTSLSRANEAPVIGEHHWNLSGSIQAQLTLSLAVLDGIRYLSADYENGLIGREDAVKNPQARYSQVFL